MAKFETRFTFLYAILGKTACCRFYQAKVVPTKLLIAEVSVHCRGKSYRDANVSIFNCVMHRLQHSIEFLQLAIAQMSIVLLTNCVTVNICVSLHFSRSSIQASLLF